MEMLSNHGLLPLFSTDGIKPSLYNLGKLYLGLIGADPNKIFSQLGDYNFWDAQYLQPYGESWGMDTMNAFRCLIDVNRTATLLTGINETVKSLKYTDHPLVGIDAGTGTGILSIGLILSGCDKVFALEINPRTARVAQQFLQELGLSDRVEVIQCDATNIDLDDLQADILVSENLSCGLFDEPQYQIIHHLSPYLADGAKILPYRSEFFVSLGRSSWDNIDESTVAARKLKDLVCLTTHHRYFDITSIKGMALTKVAGKIAVDVGSLAHCANTLIVSSRFQINDGPNPSYLEPDTAEFLGKSASFKLNCDILAQSQPLTVSLQYSPGMPRKHALVTVTNNSVELSGSGLVNKSFIC